MPSVTFGNVSVLEPWKPDEGSTETKLRSRKDLGQQETSFYLPPENPEDTVNPVTGRRDGWDLQQWLGAIDSMWRMHSDAQPAWVESDDENLQKLLSGIYGCREGRPRDWRRGADFAEKSAEKVESKKRTS